ncbi:bucentaur or craniofacial development-domain-containing protein [Papiliotrema laurentii]|uniref:SWR1-complex protein 5 n=1 Tax=Papiliotrema laurentii TaxID=5418 RepID=A0AAD9CST9_PAPLA|nr:bucentaur or craniofacial development-domain-containing protein [Papiliotrema laurentii]
MSTLNSAKLDSDDEDDQDFIPSLPKPRNGKAQRKRPRTTESDGSGSSSPSDGEDGEDDEDLRTEAKRLRAEQEQAETEKRKKDAEALFKSMMEEPAAPQSPAPEKAAPVETVEIKRPRQFAGETIYETVLLSRDHPDAVAHFAREAALKGAESESSPAPSGSGLTASTISPKSTILPSGSTAPQTSQAGSLASSSPKTIIKSRPPVRRKPRQSLEAMSAALDKGKKMTTLEKSQMDWKSHTSADPSIQAELEANRRGGGYLEKQQFLDRVGERRTGALDGSRK